MSSGIRAFTIFLATTVVTSAFGTGWQSSNPHASSKGVVLVAVILGAVAAFFDWRVTRGVSLSTGKVQSRPPEKNAVSPDRIARIATRAQSHPTASSVQEAPPALPPQHKPPLIRDTVPDFGKSAILFRQHFPPRHDPACLSFFGGAPIAPSGFIWPKSAGQDVEGNPTEPKSLHLLMQIDCAAIPSEGGLSLLPDHGVIYLFLDLNWGLGNGFRILFSDAPAGNWAELPLPTDLAAPFGDEAKHAVPWLSDIPGGASHCPRLLPKWTFDPVVIPYSPDADEDDNPDSESEGAEAALDQAPLADTLAAAQGAAVISDTFSVRDFDREQCHQRLTEANFPQDWQAVQICAGLAYNRTQYDIRNWSYKKPPTGLPQREADAIALSIKEKAESAGPGTPDELAARIAETTASHLTEAIAAFEQNKGAEIASLEQLASEAQDLFNHATAESSFTAVPPVWAQKIRNWLTENHRHLRLSLPDILTLATESSLEHSPEAAARVPSAIAKAIHSRHALASYYDGKPHASNPDRMLAPASDVQGEKWEMCPTHLLLFEFSSNDGLRHYFGEGVYQFWITPADLKARRFDKVELIASAY